MVVEADFRVGEYRTIDWVHASVKDQFRKKKLRGIQGFRGLLVNSLDAVEGWILVGIIGSPPRPFVRAIFEVETDVGVVTALIAYCIDVWESVLFDWKDGYCSSMPPLPLVHFDES